MKENTDFKMYFKTEILFFSICHAVEWNFGAGFVSDTRNANTICWILLLHAFVMYIIHFGTLCVPLRCHRRAQSGATAGAQSEVSAWCPAGTWCPCGPRSEGGSRAPGGSHTARPPPASAFLVRPIQLRPRPNKEGSGGASALLAGKWKEKEGAFSASQWIRWWMEPSQHGHENLPRRFFEEAGFCGSHI